MSINEPNHLYAEPEELAPEIAEQLIDESEALELALECDSSFLDAVDDLQSSTEFAVMMTNAALMKKSRDIDNVANLVEECEIFMNKVIERMIRNDRVRVLGYE